jgi:hypothetical protein
MHAEMIQAMRTEFGIKIFRKGYTWNKKQDDNDNIKTEGTKVGRRDDS